MTTPKPRLFLLPISILPPLRDVRDRRSRDYLEWFQRLKDDIAARGIRNDLLVKVEGERYRCIAGWTRREVAVALGLLEVPCKVVECLTAADELRETWLENQMRRDPTLSEMAQFLLAYMKETKSNQRDGALALGIDPSYASRILTINGRMNEEELALVEKQTLQFRAAHALASVFENPVDRKPWIDKLVAGFLTVESLEGELARLKCRSKGRKPKVVKVKEGQVSAEFPASYSWENIIAFAQKLLDAAKKGVRNELPTSSLGNLLK